MGFGTRGILFDHVVLVIVEAAFLLTRQRPYHVEYTSLLTKALEFADFRLRHVGFGTRGILFDHVVLVIVDAAFLLTKALK